MAETDWLEVLFQNDRVGVAISQHPNGIVRANAFLADFLGYSEEELVGKTFLSLTHPDHLEVQTNLINSAVSGTSGCETYVKQYIRKDGQPVWAQIFAQILQADEQGQTFLSIIHDIDDETRDRLLLEKRVQEEEASRLRAEKLASSRANFLATISHEVRTPLTGVMGLIELTLDSDLDTVQEMRLKQAQQSAVELMNLLGDFLDFAKVEAGAIEVAPRATEIRALIGSIIDAARFDAVSKGLDLTFTVERSVPDILLIDAQKVQQVLQNVIGNSVKFTDKGSVTCHVDWKRGELGGNLLVEVSDTGPGIAKTQLQRVFEPFAQEDTSMTRRHGGAGLGLAIAKRFLDQMESEISLTSAKGKGTKVRITIPCLVATKAMSQLKDHSAKPSKALRILIAEDNMMNRELLAAILEKSGHQVLLAQDGREAVYEVERAAPEMVLMDIQMPVLDGIEATRQIRALSSKTRNVPIVGLTANVQDEVEKACRAAGMNGFVGKPYREDQILQAIAEALSG